MGFIWKLWIIYYQKQPPEVFCKKMSLKIFVNFTGKHLGWSLFRVSGLKTWHVFSCEIWEIFKITYFEGHLRTAVSIFYHYLIISMFQELVLFLFSLYNFVFSMKFFAILKRSTIHTYVLKVEVSSEPNQAFKMELFVKIVNDKKLLTIFAKSSILNVWLGSNAPLVRFI